MGGRRKVSLPGMQPSGDEPSTSQLRKAPSAAEDDPFHGPQHHLLARVLDGPRPHDAARREGDPHGALRGGLVLELWPRIQVLWG